MLRALDEPHVLWHENCYLKIKKGCLTKQLRATIAFDAVAGEMTGRLLDALPGGSSVVVYGALSNEKCRELDPVGLLFGNKRVEPFYLGAWLKRKSFPATLRIVRKSQALIADGTLRTNIARRIPLSGLREGLIDYVRHLSEGKAVLLLR